MGIVQSMKEKARALDIVEKVLLTALLIVLLLGVVSFAQENIAGESSQQDDGSRSRPASGGGFGSIGRGFGGYHND